MRSLLLSLPALLAAAASGNAMAQVAPIRLEPVTRIGCIECSGPEMFTAIGGIDVRGGSIYVTDIGAPPGVRVFDTSGSSLRAFGRRGDGPGELRRPMLIHALADGGMEVYDMQQMRLTRFDSTGAATGTRRLGSGFFVILAHEPGDDALYFTSLESRTAERPVLRMAADTDSAERFVLLRSDFPVMRTGDSSPGIVRAARPAGGLAVGDGRIEYRIRLFDANGTAVGDIVRDIPRQRKTNVELEAEANRRNRMRGVMTSMMERRGMRPRLPDFAPDPLRYHFSAMDYDDRGRLWVQTRRGDLRETIFDIFDPAGRYLGELMIPERVEAFAVGSGLLAGRVYDGDGVQYVAAWRIH